MLSLFECITRSSSVSLGKVKLITLVNGISHLSEFLRSFMMSFKYGLILLSYSSIDKFLYLSPLPSYST